MSGRVVALRTLDGLGYVTATGYVLDARPRVDRVDGGYVAFFIGRRPAVDGASIEPRPFCRFCVGAGADVEDAIADAHAKLAASIRARAIVAAQREV